jgi:hypothetical protein
VAPTWKSTKKFGRSKMRTRREAVAMSSDGQIAGSVGEDHEHKDLLRWKDNRRSFATIDLSEEEVEAIASSRMNPHHETSK